MTSTTGRIDTHGDRYGNAFLVAEAPDDRLPALDRRRVKTGTGS